MTNSMVKRSFNRTEDTYHGHCIRTEKCKKNWHISPRTIQISHSTHEIRHSLPIQIGPQEQSSQTDFELRYGYCVAQRSTVVDSIFLSVRLISSFMFSILHSFGRCVGRHFRRMQCARYKVFNSYLFRFQKHASESSDSRIVPFI